MRIEEKIRRFLIAVGEESSFDEVMELFTRGNRISERGFSFYSVALGVIKISEKETDPAVLGEEIAHHLFSPITYEEVFENARIEGTVLKLLPPEEKKTVLRLVLTAPVKNERRTKYFSCASSISKALKIDEDEALDIISEYFGTLGYLIWKDVNEDEERQNSKLREVFRYHRIHPLLRDVVYAANYLNELEKEVKTLLCYGEAVDLMKLYGDLVSTERKQEVLETIRSDSLEKLDERYLPVSDSIVYGISIPSVDYDISHTLGELAARVAFKRYGIGALEISNDDLENLVLRVYEKCSRLQELIKGKFAGYSTNKELKINNDWVSFKPIRDLHKKLFADIVSRID